MNRTRVLTTEAFNDASASIIFYFYFVHNLSVNEYITRVAMIFQSTRSFLSGG